MLDDYFKARTAELSGRPVRDIRTLQQWQSRRDELRHQLADMLGLLPMPPRTDLKAVITGRLDHERFILERLHFQSRPGLYVTASLYLPRNTDKPSPAILYLCGHGTVKKDGISYGAKAHYHYWGAWLAANGYVCLMLDTLQLGEIEGLHHGTYRENMWWWHSRGYTPAGVETWNAMRALDYLQSRPEVDAKRIGVTGRSGGGAYSWWLTALDDRVAAAVPVAGITDLANHVVDGCIEGHCDCMYMVNFCGWDFATVAALAAPRPLLISNTDKDSIFPLDGVVRVHAQVKRIYDLYNAADKLGLLITDGPHKDTQELQIPAIRWFNRFLKSDDAPVESAPRRCLEPEQLRVFSTVPADQINTRIHELFVPVASPPEDAIQLRNLRDSLVARLLAMPFAGWPEVVPDPSPVRAWSVEKGATTFERWDFRSQQGVQLPLFVARPAARRCTAVRLEVLDEPDWRAWLPAIRRALPEQFAQYPPAREPDKSDDAAPLPAGIGPDEAVVWFVPRGAGPTAWTDDPKSLIHIRRRFALLGQTLDGMRVWDVRRAIQALRSLDGLKEAPLTIQARATAAGWAVYAAIFEPAPMRLCLRQLPASHHDAAAPALLGVMRIMDMPHAVKLAAARHEIVTEP